MIRRPIERVKPDVIGARRMLASNAIRLRLALKMTQLIAAERAGIDPRHWQKIEAEATNVTLATLVRVAAALDVEIAALFTPLRKREPASPTVPSHRSPPAAK